MKEDRRMDDQEGSGGWGREGVGRERGEVEWRKEGIEEGGKGLRGNRGGGGREEGRTKRARKQYGLWNVVQGFLRQSSPLLLSAIFPTP